MDKTYQISDFINKSLPQDILDQMKVMDRVKHYLKPTSTSAISQIEDQPDDSKQSQRDAENEIDKLIDDVKEFEDLVEQLEDLADEHLKNMAIPAENNLISDAIKKLGGTDGVITKEVLDKAQAVIDYFPMSSLGFDPILAALIGDGTIDGPYLNCSNITSDIAKNLKLKARDLPSAETVLKDQASQMNDTHDKKMKNFLKEFMLNFWWNQLWPKYIVDLTIINPARIFSTPPDTVVCFFKKIKWNNQEYPRFRRKPKECVVGTSTKGYVDANGPMSKILVKLRVLLLCDLPKSIYKEYNPGKEIGCPSQPNKPCPPKTDNPKDMSGMKNMSDMGSIYDDIDENQPCFDLNDLMSNVNSNLPSGFGFPSECVQAAKTILDATLSDALTPLEKSS